MLYGDCCRSLLLRYGFDSENCFCSLSLIIRTRRTQHGATQQHNRMRTHHHPPITSGSGMTDIGALSGSPVNRTDRRRVGCFCLLWRPRANLHTKRREGISRPGGTPSDASAYLGVFGEVQTYVRLYPYPRRARQHTLCAHILPRSTEFWRACGHSGQHGTGWEKKRASNSGDVLRNEEPF